MLKFIWIWKTTKQAIELRNGLTRLKREEKKQHNVHLKI